MTVTDSKCYIVSLIDNSDMHLCILDQLMVKVGRYDNRSSEDTLLKIRNTYTAYLNNFFSFNYPKLYVPFKINIISTLNDISAMSVIFMLNGDIENRQSLVFVVCVTLLRVET